VAPIPDAATRARGIPSGLLIVKGQSTALPRGGKGPELLQRGQFTGIVYSIPAAPQGFGE
jgi:hypothetical protein